MPLARLENGLGKVWIWCAWSCAREFEGQMWLGLTRGTITHPRRVEQCGWPAVNGSIVGWLWCKPFVWQMRVCSRIIALLCLHERWVCLCVCARMIFAWLWIAGIWKCSNLKPTCRPNPKIILNIFRIGWISNGLLVGSFSASCQAVSGSYVPQLWRLHLPEQRGGWSWWWSGPYLRNFGALDEENVWAVEVKSGTFWNVWLRSSPRKYVGIKVIWLGGWGLAFILAIQHSWIWLVWLLFWWFVRFQGHSNVLVCFFFFGGLFASILKLWGLDAIGQRFCENKFLRKSTNDCTTFCCSMLLCCPGERQTLGGSEVTRLESLAVDQCWFSGMTAGSIAPASIEATLWQGVGLSATRPALVKVRIPKHLGPFERCYVCHWV